MSIQTVTVTPHLNFRGQARAALAFYQAVFDGEIRIATYRDAGRMDDPRDADLVIWGQVVAQSGFRIMAFDVASAMPHHPGENAFYVSVRGESDDEVRTLWERLAAGATVVHALAPAQWSSLYGMLKDRFGVTWVLDVAMPNGA